MKLKQIRKKIGRLSGRAFVLSCFFILSLFSWRALYAFARFLARASFLVAGKHRKIALHGLHMAFEKEKTDEQIRQIAKDCFNCLAKTAVEICYFQAKPATLKDRISLENKHILDEAIAKGKGVILVSGHFGNFPAMLAKLAVQGYAAGGIMRPMRDTYMEKVFTRIRDRIGVKTIHSKPRKACVDTTIRALKNNEIIFLPLDQNFGTGGVFVDFFGQKAATAVGPVVLALRTKSVLLPCFIIRDKDDKQRIVFEREFNLKQEESFDKTVQTNIQALTAIIESYIRRYPSHWAWIHRRWKTRPKI